MMNDKLLFEDRKKFRAWLSKNHGSDDAIWLVFGKNGKLKTLKASEALEEALCYGWIDGLIKRVDDISYVKRFTHRRKNSQWSEYNKTLVKKLVESGLMTKYGMKEIDSAKETGHWNTPERKPVTKEQIQMFLKLIEGTEPAFTNFIKMSPSVRKTYTAFYMDAKKEETRKRRLDNIIKRLNANKKPM